MSESPKPHVAPVSSKEIFEEKLNGHQNRLRLKRQILEQRDSTEVMVSPPSAPSLSEGTAGVFDLVAFISQYERSMSVSLTLLSKLSSFCLSVCVSGLFAASL